jgi:hypothetical protein
MKMIRLEKKWIEVDTPKGKRLILIWEVTEVERDKKLSEEEKEKKKNKTNWNSLRVLIGIHGLVSLMSRPLKRGEVSC